MTDSSGQSAFDAKADAMPLNVRAQDTIAQILSMEAIDTQRAARPETSKSAAADSSSNSVLDLPATALTSTSAITEANITHYNFTEALQASSLNFIDTPAQPPAALTYVQTEDGKTQIGYRENTAVYCQDSTGKWDSSDGRSWVQRGTNGQRIWHGTVNVTKDDNYATVNSETGVRRICHNDGRTTTSIVDANGQTIEIIKNARGVDVECTDSTGTWTSIDGHNWTNNDTGDRNSSSAYIDQFGRYFVKPEGKPEAAYTESREFQAVRARQQQLSDRYGVTFPQPGEAKIYDGKDLTLRPPTTAELDCLSDMLRQNQQLDVRGMRFSFVQSSDATDNYGLWGVYQHTGHDNKPDLVLFPKNTQIRGWASLEGTLQHELVHHEQYLRWGAGHWGGQGSHAEANQLMQDLGWVRVSGEATYRIIDKDGEHWQNNTTSGRWEPIVNGKPEPNRAITNSVMRERALVRPATAYFTQPWEMHAESLAMYRYHGQQLWAENSDLYAVMKRYDQREINRTFGTRQGQPRSIRGADGSIVPNTAENRRSVNETEQGWSQLLFVPELVHRSGGCAHCQRG